MRQRMRHSSDIYFDDLALPKLYIEFINKITAFTEANLPD